MIKIQPIDSKIKIFLSCGQIGKEVDTAREIKEILEGGGRADVYIAKIEQSLEDLLAKIADELQKCDVYLFIDFKREELTDKDKKFHRGSLFTHQELAMAYLLSKNQNRNFKVFGYAEEGVYREGIANCFPLNADRKKFKDHSQLIKFINDDKEEILRSPKIGLDVSISDYYCVENSGIKYFRVKVNNQFKYVIQRCRVYAQHPELESYPLTWSYSNFIELDILPGSALYFDAFNEKSDEGKRERFLQIHKVDYSFNSFNPYTHHRIQDIKSVKYKLIADNMPEQVFILTEDDLA